MSYKVSKYINSIKNIGDKKPSILDIETFCFFNTYQEAKSFLIQRAKNKIELCEQELANLKKSLKKLEALEENSQQKSPFTI